MPAWIDPVVKRISTVGGLLSALAAIAALLAVLLNWKGIYNALNIQHVNQSLRTAVCRKSYPAVPNAYPFTVGFQDSDCESVISKMNLVAGILSKSYICGGMDNFDIHLNPRAVTFYGIRQGCAAHPSEITVIYLGTRND